jgi:hypothetical protein
MKRGSNPGTIWFLRTVRKSMATIWMSTPFVGSKPSMVSGCTSAANAGMFWKKPLT